MNTTTSINEYRKNKIDEINNKYDEMIDNHMADINRSEIYENNVRNLSPKEMFEEGLELHEQANAIINERNEKLKKYGVNTDEKTKEREDRLKKLLGQI